MLRETMLRRLEALEEELGPGRDGLLPMLQAMQEAEGFAGPEAIGEIARFYDLSPTEVFSVASFYHFLNTTERGRFVIRICRTISCDLRNKDAVLHALEAELGIRMGQTTDDRMYTLDYANCMGTCDRGPSMMVNDDLYADLTPSKAVEIVRSYR